MRWTYYKVIIDKKYRETEVQSEFVYRKNKDKLDYFNERSHVWMISCFYLRNKVFYKRTDRNIKRNKKYTITRLTKADTFLEFL